MLVDTMSYGVRILSSALSASVSGALTQEKNASGNSVAECAQFSDSITWGPVKTADVKIAGEEASAIPIQLIGDPAFSTIPSGCTSAGAPEDTLASLGANGILGIGPFVQDCPACVPGTTNNQNFYYACVGSSCSVTTIGLPSRYRIRSLHSGPTIMESGRTACGSVEHHHREWNVDIWNRNAN